MVQEQRRDHSGSLCLRRIENDAEFGESLGLLPAYSRTTVG